MKVRFSTKFRERLSEKLMDLGNYVAIGLVFGQFVSDKPFSLPIFILGIAITLTCYLFSYLINR